MIKKYRKKPVTIEAIQWDGKNICNVGLKCANRSDGKYVIFKEVKE